MYILQLTFRQCVEKIKTCVSLPWLYNMSNKDIRKQQTSSITMTSYVSFDLWCIPYPIHKGLCNNQPLFFDVGCVLLDS